MVKCGVDPFVSFIPILVLSLSTCRNNTRNVEEMVDLEKKIEYFKHLCPERAYNF